MLLAIITAGMLSTVHTGTAPAVNVAVPNGPKAVFARPAPAPAKPLAQGPPLILPREPGVACLQYNVDAALDAKSHPNANGDIHSQGASCYQGHPPRA
jgi:hypothetical protein